MEEDPILASTADLELPRIHDFDARHLGFGLFEVSTAEYTIQYDAGTLMHQLPSGTGAWSRASHRGDPYEEAKAKLRRYLAFLKMETDEVDQATVIEASTDMIELEDDVTADDGSPAGASTDASTDERDQALGPDKDSTTEGLDEGQEPDDRIPEHIEVDLGDTHGWAVAEVERVRGKWLYYALAEQDQDKPDGHGGEDPDLRPRHCLACGGEIARRRMAKDPSALVSSRALLYSYIVWMIGGNRGVQHR